jgi:hypothetical protein
MSEERKRILSMVAAGKLTVEEAEELLNAIGKKGSIGGDAAAIAESPSATKNPKFLRVMVDSMEGDNVNVRVPVGLMRTGLKLSSLLPRQAYDKINENMAQHGFNFDLNNLKNADIDQLVESMSELNVDVNSAKGDRVKVYFE